MAKGGLLFCLFYLNPDHFGLRLHEGVRPTYEIQSRPQLQEPFPQEQVRAKQLNLSTWPCPSWCLHRQRHSHALVSLGISPGEKQHGRGICSNRGVGLEAGMSTEGWASVLPYCWWLLSCTELILLFSVQWGRCTWSLFQHCKTTGIHCLNRNSS